MAKRGEVVRLTDLERPWVPAPFRVANSVLGPLAKRTLRFEPDALLRTATKQTGLHDFGDTRFREPLAILCEALEREARLSAFGRFACRSLVLQQLVGRLRLQALLTAHPEIHDIPIEAPIVILGLPRTGTTHLHTMLSQHPSLRSLPYWESLEPFPSPADASASPDPRIARCEMAVKLIGYLMPHFAAMHEMEADLPHEEMQLLGLDFASMIFEASYAVPSYGDWWKRVDQTESYRYLRTVLKALTFLRGGKRWLLKTPQHLSQIGPLIRAFPDARVIHTHRDPARVTVSMVTLAVYAQRMNSADVDARASAAYWTSRVEDLLRDGVRDRDRGLVPDDQIFDVRFDALMEDNVAMVEKLCAFAGLPFDDAIRARMQAYLDANPPGRHGTIDYRFEDVFLDEKERRAALAFYGARFGVRDEAMKR